jgi:hypothetical protein
MNITNPRSASMEVMREVLGATGWVSADIRRL